MMLLVVDSKVSTMNLLRESARPSDRRSISESRGRGNFKDIITMSGLLNSLYDFICWSSKIRYNTKIYKSDILLVLFKPWLCDLLIGFEWL
jgi:hypothetical protein